MVLSSLEAGAAFFVLFPSFLGPKTDVKTLMSPAWEVTNVFLVFSAIGLLSFFSPALVDITTHLFVPLSLAAILIALRALSVMLLFYASAKHRFLKWLFFLTSFLTPLVLLSVIRFALVGGSQQSWMVTLSLGGLVLATIFWLSGTFFAFIEKAPLNQLSRLISLSSWAFLLFSVLLVLSLKQESRYLFANFGQFWLITILFFVSWSNATLRRSTEHAKVGFVSALLSMIILFLGLGLLHYPYIIYPDVTLASSFVGSDTFAVLIVGFVIGMVFVLPGLYLLYGLILGGFER